MKRTDPGWRAVTVLLGVLTAVFVRGFVSEAVAQEPGERGDADAGREVFANNCAACHGGSGEGRGAAPSLDGVFERHAVDDVETIIRQGRAGMPGFDTTLSDEQVDDVLAHVAQLSDDEAVASRRGPHMDRWWDDMMWNGVGGAFMLIWMVFGLLVLVLIVVGIVWLVRRTADGSRPQQHWQPPAHGSAREELDRRYARGEISREEYLAIRADLEGRSDG